jgi:hypothetical protein
LGLGPGNFQSKEGLCRGENTFWENEYDGSTALMLAVAHVDAVRLLLDHPAADPAALMAVRSKTGDSALQLAAAFATGRLHSDHYHPSCVPLLLLLRRVATDVQPSDARQAHMSEVMEALMDEWGRDDLFSDDDQPDGARDGCVRLLLLELGGGGFDSYSPVMKRIIREVFQLARVPQLLNEAVGGMAAVQK